MTEPPFSRVGIVGLGLIGGSIALRARLTWPGITLVGFDSSPEASTAARRTVVHETADAVADLSESDLIILAVPLGAIIAMMPALARLETGAVVTDVGSTKRQVMAAARAAGVPRFVGGHPMSGSEHVGLDHARADLFEGRPWLFVTEGGDAAVCARLDQFVAGLGAAPRWIAAEAHDRAVAYVSHLPQLLAVALMNATRSGVGDEGLATAGRAFAEMTRLASSPPDLWQGILSDNSDFVAEATSRFIASLPAAADLGDGRWIREAFTRAGLSRLRSRGADDPEP